MTLPDLNTPNLMLDFGPPLAYENICAGYTVEKLSLWEYTEKDRFLMIPVKAPEMPKAKAEGTIYRLSDEELLALDKKRGVGYYYERKRTLVMTPFNLEGGALIRVYAWVYFGKRDYWAPQIKHDNAYFRNGGRQFKMTQQIHDNDRDLANRFCFLPPPPPIQLARVPAPSIVEACTFQNRKETRALQIYRIKKRIMHFLNDE